MTGRGHTRRVPTVALSPVLEALRGDPEERPAVDLAAAAGLRARLETAARGAARVTPGLRVGAGGLRTRRTATAPLAAALRGLLVASALRLLAVGARPQSPGTLLTAWRAAEGDSALALASDQLGAEERARLESDVAAHVATLRARLGSVPPTWAPRTAVRAHQRLAGGGVVLRDVVDLMVGTTLGPSAAVSLLDVTTAPLGEDDERVARYHALVQTLRTATVPLRSAVLSTATGELWCLEVDAATLERAVDELVAVLGAPAMERAA